MSDNKIEQIAASLWKDQSEKNWNSLKAALKKSKIKYYKVVYEKGKLNEREDLRRSFAELYDLKEKLIAKTPIFRTEGKTLEGATIYLKGLLNINR